MLLKVTVNGQSFPVDAPNKASAKAYGKTKLEIKVEELSAADMLEMDVTTIHKIELPVKTPAADAPAA